jgi:flagellar L-ring protein FlgH
MQRIVSVILVAASVALWAAPAQAQSNSLWERRDPKTAYLFWDYRARQVGDVLTIVVNEVTESDAQEKRNMNKQTNTSAALNLKGSGSVGNSGTRQFANELDGQVQSQRKFDGQSNTTIDRKFADRMSVVVVGVYVNGNLLIEGYRERVVAREKRILRVSGIVRPADIGPFNQVQSQYIANFAVTYQGRGPDSNYTSQGWGGRLMNIVWPF